MHTPTYRVASDLSEPFLVICFDASTMQEVGRQEDFKRLEMVLFEKQ